MKREHLFPVIIMVVTTAVMALAIEAFVRLVGDDGMQFDLEMWKYAIEVKRVAADPLIGHEHRPNRQAKLMGVDFKTNSKGLRDREFSYERTPGTRRIMMLGDSITVGWGVPVDDTFAKRVEQMFTEKGSRVEVINTGVGNYNTVQEVEFFLTEGIKYKPDILVLSYFVNDAEPVPKSAPPTLLQRRCMSCVFIAGRVDTLRRMWSPSSNWAGYYLGLFGHGETPGWQESKRYLRLLGDYCKANGIRLVIANIPELHDVRNYRFQQITDLVRQSAVESGAVFVDLLPYLKDTESWKLWVTPGDPHPNSYADGLIAKGLFEALEKLPPPTLANSASSTSVP